MKPHQTVMADSTVQSVQEKRRASTANMAQALNGLVSVDGDGGVDIEQIRTKLEIPTYADTLNTRKVALSHVKEMCVYSIFVILFTFTTLQGRNEQDIFFFTDAVRVQLTEIEFPFSSAHVEKTFNDIATVEEFWQYIHGPFYNGLWTAATFDGADANFDAMPTDQTVTDTDPNRRGYMLGYNRLIGGVRFGTTRVEGQRCSIAEQFKYDPTPGAKDNWVCYPTYYDSLIKTNYGFDTDNWGMPDRFDQMKVNVGATTESVGLHLGDAGSEPEFTSPTTSNSFYAPRHYVTLPNVDPYSSSQDRALGKSKVWNTLTAMRDNKFIDRKTSAVSIDLTLYNPNLQYMTVVRLLAEMPSSGGVITTHKFTTLRMYRYFTAEDYVRFALEIVLMLMVIRYTVIELHAIRREGVMRFLLPANMPHNLNLFLFYVSTGLRIIAEVDLPSTLDASTDAFIPLRSAANYLELSADCNAFNAMLTWIKVTKYLNFIPKFKILLGTLQAAASRVSGFLVITCVVIFGSSQAFMMAFGTNLYGYRNLTQSFFTLMRMLLGDFDFESLRIIKPYLGPGLFFLFVMLAVFVLLNMFIAIISDAFEHTKQDLERPEAAAAAKALGKEIANAFFKRGLYRIPHIGGWAHKYVNQVGNIAEAKSRDIRDLFELMDRNLHESPADVEEVTESLEIEEANGTIMNKELVTTLMEVGLEEDDAKKVVDAIDADDSGCVSVEELEGVLKPKVHGYHRQSSGGSGFTPKVAPIHTVSDASAVRADESKAELGEGGVETDTARVYVIERLLSKASVSAELGKDPTTARRVLNHVRLVILIKKTLRDELRGDNVGSRTPLSNEMTLLRNIMASMREEGNRNAAFQQRVDRELRHVAKQLRELASDPVTAATGGLLGSIDS